MYYYIYKILNPLTGEFYIGRRKSKVKPEEDSYKGSSQTWYKTLDKNFIDDVLIKEILDSNFSSIEDLSIAEHNYILENIKNPLCKNSYVPSKGFFTSGPLSEDHKRKISKGLVKSKEDRSNKRIGKIPSMESRKKMSDSHKGVKLSEDHKKKISESLVGKTPSDEHKKKISETKKGKKFTEDHKKKLSESKKEEHYLKNINKN